MYLYIVHSCSVSVGMNTFVSWILMREIMNIDESVMNINESLLCYLCSWENPEVM